MFKIYLTSIVMLISLTLFAKENHQPCFIENNGQITDQNSNPRNDIQFCLASEGISVFVGSCSAHYQFVRQGDQDDIETYRLDAELLGANKNAQVIKEQPLAYHEQYYLPHCNNGVQANSFGRIIYKEVYPGIDWVLYIKDDKLEHDFVLRSGAKLSDIRVRYNGAASININNDGRLNITTPFGTINESAPIAYDSKGKKIQTSFRLIDNTLSFDAGQYSGSLTIDPTVEWATYYGANTSEEYSFDIAADDSGYIYMAGNTSYMAPLNVIATTGAFQTTHAGGNLDAFLVKFDSNGVRQWATYYGGSWQDYRTLLAADHFNGIYILFSTQSPGLATPGAYKDVSDGSPDAVLAKFNSNGARVWATYFGQGNVESGLGIACDQGTNVYISGQTSSPTGVATTGSFLETNADSGAAYLARFDSSGALIWCTYYGGDTTDHGYNVATDYAGNVYLSGSTLSDSGIATIGSHQPIYNGTPIDLFLVKFDSTGQRLWATYYGGNGYEDVPHVSCDSNNNVYLSSYTNSTNNIASANGWQPVYGGGFSDLFVAKFNASGVRQWGTYYGGSDDDFNFYIWDVGNVHADKAGNCYLVGNTKSNNNIASPGAYQSALGGQDDGFIAMFNPAGNRMFGTYYGGNGKDGCLGIATVGDHVYVSGMTRSTNGISTTNSHQPAYGGGISEAFLVKFNKCSAYQPSITQTDLTLSVDPFTFYQWYLNGTVIPGADSQSYTATQDGYYYVIVTDSLGCTNYSDTVTISNTGIHPANSRGGLTLYPSPNEGSFMISGKLASIKKEITVAITDAMGRLVYTRTSMLPSEQINERIELDRSIPTGTYLVKIITDSGTAALIFAKQ